MKTNMLATSLLLSLGLSVASAGQPNPRFYGVWVGTETYEIPTQGGGPVQKSAVIEIGDFGKTLVFGQGLLQGRVEIHPRWGANTLVFNNVPFGGASAGLGGTVAGFGNKFGNSGTFGGGYGAGTGAGAGASGRTEGRLVLSADGNTLTEIAHASLTGMTHAVACNISGTFHRQGKK